MTLADDLYHELATAGLAPSVPFRVADDRWREPILAVLGRDRGAREKLESLRSRFASLQNENEELRDRVIELEVELKEEREES